MENAFKLNVPLKVEAEEGKSWYQAKQNRENKQMIPLYKI